MPELEDDDESFFGESYDRELDSSQDDYDDEKYGSEDPDKLSEHSVDQSDNDITPN